MKADYVEFTRQLHFTGEWYNHALIGVEKGGGYGDTVISYLRDGHEGRRSYINLYRHRAYDDRRKKLKTSYGLPMTAATRAKVVAELARWVNGKALPWVSRRFSVEARTFDLRGFPATTAVDGGRLSWSYTTDDVGNIAAIAQSAPASVSRTFGYQDFQYFLDSASGPWPGPPAEHN